MNDIRNLIFVASGGTLEEIPKSGIYSNGPLRTAAAKKFIGEDGMFLYAVQIEGVDPKYMDKPHTASEALKKIEEWKKGAKKGWVFTKPRKGQKPGPQLRSWLKDYTPSEFYAKWDLRVDDDTREIYYKP